MASEPKELQATEVLGSIRDHDPIGPPWHVELHFVGCQMRDERCAAVGVEVAIRTIRTLETGASKTGAKIADLIDPCVRGFLMRVFQLEDAVVDVFQVPIVDDCHQHPQAVQFSRAREWILTPRPLSNLRSLIRFPLQPHAMHGAVAVDHPLTTMDVGRHLVDANFVDEVLLFGGVADSPQQTTGRRFRARLRA